MSSFWPPADGCETDPVSQQRRGPGVLSLMIWMFFAMGLIIGTIIVLAFNHLLSVLGMDGFQMRLWFTLVLSYVALYMYLAFQQRCRPWTGFAVYLFSGVLISMFAQLIWGSSGSSTATAVPAVPSTIITPPVRNSLFQERNPTTGKPVDWETVQGLAQQIERNYLGTACDLAGVREPTTGAWVASIEQKGVQLAANKRYELWLQMITTGSEEVPTFPVPEDLMFTVTCGPSVSWSDNFGRVMTTMSGFYKSPTVRPPKRSGESVDLRVSFSSSTGPFRIWLRQVHLHAFFD